MLWGASWRQWGPLLTPSLCLPLGLGPGHCRLGPCCHFGSLQGELPNFASFTPPLPPPLPSDWTRLSGAFLPPLVSERQLPGNPKPNLLLPGPPLLPGLEPNAGERLRLLSLRPEGPEKKPNPKKGAQGGLEPRADFSSQTHGLRAGEESSGAPNPETFKAVWPLDPP